MNRACSSTSCHAGESILLASPTRDPLLDLFIRDEIAALRSFDSTIDLLLDVYVVLNILVRCAVRDSVEKPPNFFLGEWSCHCFASG
jgi:hypothetical protein